MISNLFAGHPKKMMLRFGLTFFVMTSAILGTLYVYDMRHRSEAQYAQMLERAEARAADKTGVFNQWLAEVTKTSKAFTEADLVKIFMAEQTYTHSESAPQESYIQHTLTDIQKRLQGRGAILTTPNGETVINSKNAEMLSIPQKSIPTFVEMVHHKRMMLGSLIKANGQAYIEIFLPILNLERIQNQKVVGGLYLQVGLGSVLASLAPSDSAYDKTFIATKAAEAQWHLLSAKDAGFTFEELPHLSGLITTDEVGKAIQGVAYIAEPDHAILHRTAYNWAMLSHKQYSTLFLWFVVLATALLSVIFVGLLWQALVKRDKKRVHHLGQMVNAFMRAIETRDEYLLGHHERVARLSLKIGNRLGLNTTERGTLYYSAKLAGIGKMFIPEKVLNKKSKLTKDERSIVQGHVERTLRVLDGVEFELPVRETIHQMYERADGSGYPNGLTLADIDLKAQILGVSDAYCALIQPRVYRKALTPQEAVKELESQSEKFSKLILQALKDAISN